jgi:hypothetical protein
MTDKIRRLLQKGKTAQEIAAQLKIKPNRVYTVKWLDAKKQKPSKIIKAVKETKTALDSIERFKDMVGTTVGGLTFVEIENGKYRWIRNDLAEKYKKTTSSTDLVNHPPHYKSGGIETIDFIEAKDLNYRLGNVIKYVSRAGKKASDPVQDLEKAAWYLQREIDARKSA